MFPLLVRHRRDGDGIVVVTSIRVFIIGTMRVLTFASSCRAMVVTTTVVGTIAPVISKIRLGTFCRRRFCLVRVLGTLGPHMLCGATGGAVYLCHRGQPPIRLIVAFSTVMSVVVMPPFIMVVLCGAAVMTTSVVIVIIINELMSIGAITTWVQAMAALYAVLRELICAR